MPKDVTGDWDVVQSNNHTLHLEISSENTRNGEFSGRANIHGKAGYTDLADTKVTNDDIRFRMGEGQYMGTFDSSGQLSGVTFNRADKGKQATWVCSSRRF
ncbi:hypothetical protein ACFYRJ_17530 [Streptomyces sp. NPDC005531]|uniref:hypothetical protein n=1 Tax=Streptomyces sp. NPDC005531 TaxID=3364722 RepID=UPI0036872177